MVTLEISTGTTVTSDELGVEEIGNKYFYKGKEVTLAQIYGLLKLFASSRYHRNGVNKK